MVMEAVFRILKVTARRGGTYTRQVQKSWDAYKVTLNQGNPNPQLGSSRADCVGYSVHTFTRPNLFIARSLEGLGADAFAAVG